MPNVVVSPAPVASQQPAQIPIVTLIILVVIGLILIVLAIVAIYFVVSWVVRFIRKRNDLFWAVKSRMGDLATTHSYKRLHRWRYWLNIPIKLVTPSGEGIRISEPIGFYGGHFYSHSGNVIIRFFGHSFKDLWVIPRPEILIVNEKRLREYDLLSTDDKAKKVSQRLPTGIVQFNDGEVLLYAWGIDNADSEGVFYMPVLKDGEGNILDLSLSVYESLKDIALGDAWLSSSKLFVSGIRQAVDTNPNVRIQQKVSDTSSNIETRPMQPPNQ